MFELLSIVVFILDVAAIISILQQNKPIGWKLIWIIVVLILPFLGMLIYFLIGRS